MLKNIIMPLACLELIFLLLLWQVFVLLFASSLLAFLLIVMTPFLPFFPQIWPLDAMSLKGRALVSMLGVFVALTAASAVEKFNILVLYPFSKSLRPRSGAVLKTALEEEVQRFTSLFGIRK